MKAYECNNDIMAREDVVSLSTSGFNEKLPTIDYDIRGQEFAFMAAKERVELVIEHQEASRITICPVQRHRPYYGHLQAVPSPLGMC